MAHLNPERRAEAGLADSFAGNAKLFFELAHNRFGLSRLPMRKEPARTLRNKPAEIENRCSDDRAGGKAHSPSNVNREDFRIQNYRGRCCTGQRTQPETAVDHQINAAAK